MFKFKFLNKAKKAIKTKNKEIDINKKKDYTKKVLLEKSKEVKNFKNYIFSKKLENWNTRRRYVDYNFCFKQILNQDISNYISLKLKNKKNFSVLDDGAVRGYFLNDLYNKFNKHDLKKMSFDAITLHKEDIKKSILDKVNVHEGFIENIKFNKKYDVIFSVYGSISYTIFHKEVLLKYLNHLKKNGIILINYSDIHKHREISTKFIVELKRALEKRKFSMYHKRLQSNSPLKNDMAPDMFLIRKN
jgi:hypothetical protein